MAKPPPSLLLSFDFDGTLVNHGGELPFHPALGEMIREFRRRGAVWVINTGRGMHQTMQGLAEHSIFMKPDYLIVRECELLRPGWFKEWAEFGSWNKRARRAHDHFIEKHSGFLDDLRAYVDKETKAQFLMGDLGECGIVASSDEELDGICQIIDRKTATHRDVGYHRNGVYLRFSHADFSKGSSLRELARLLKVPRERIFAAGDNYNDLSMLDPRVAGNFACPSNALPAVKEHVTQHGGFVATKPASEGMMQALEHFFLRRS